ncbi:MAG: site-specific integrase [Phycisphaerales bacterium]|nr:site-specific integrase [Planctomycetota bacterium]MCH8508680.1 site-specific integrase [Phycisphaerales bacterium]
MRRQTGRNAAVVTLPDAASGRRHNCYLGPWGSPQAAQRYARLIAEWTAADGAVPRWAKPRAASAGAGFSVLDLTEAYWYGRVRGRYAQTHALTIRSALAALVAACGDLPADDLGPRAFREWRDGTVLPPPAGRGWSRRYANAQAGRVRGMYRWAVAEELVRPATLEALRAAEPLRAARGESARASVPPVAWAAVDAVLPFVNRQVAAMIEVQRATGARPGEVVIMRPGDLARTDEPVWIYEPGQHKGSAAGRARAIPIGPRAQRAIRPFLDRPAGRPMFSPAEAMEEHRQAQHAVRRTPASCGNRPGTNRVGQPARKPGQHYTTGSYRGAIWRACDRAFPPPGDLGPRERAAWIKSHRWSPHQIRHAVADELARRYDLVTASKMLGHSDARITAEVYTTRDVAEILRIAGECG